MGRGPIPKRGDVWLVDFDPSVGAEIQKHRPAVVLNLDGIGRMPLRIVVPVTDWKPYYADAPWFVRLSPSAGNGLRKISGADAFQIKSMSCERFVQKLGEISDADLYAIIDALGNCIGA